MQKSLEVLHGLTGAVIAFAGASAPTGWLLCYGQSVSRATYPDLFAVIGTAHGSVDGNTFNVPDLRGRTAFGLDNMGGTAAGRTSVALAGNTTNASAVIAGLSSTTSLAVGMKAAGPGIPAGATILSIDSASQVTLTANATATATAAALRFGILDGVTLGDAGGSQAHKLTTAQMPSHNHQAIMSANQYNSTSPTTAGFNTGGAGQTGTISNTGGDQAHPNMPPGIALNYLIKT